MKKYKIRVDLLYKICIKLRTKHIKNEKNEKSKKNDHYQNQYCSNIYNNNGTMDKECNLCNISISN